jgi:signal transduction histidine kinase
VLGRLQNNFAEMQEALSKHITSLQEVNNVTCKLNNELAKASVMARKADESKSEFLKDVTHQIRTPLNIINGFTQVLRDDSESIPRDEVEGLIDTMQYNAVGMNRMINMLLVAANTGKDVKINVMEEVNVHELVDALTYLYAHTPPYTVDLVTDIKLLDTFTVRSNREFLGKALAELLFNAKKFTTDGHVKLTAMASGITVIFMVEDTGPGISEETQARLFDNFEKGNIFDEGLGMGLPTCRQMIRMIGGELKFDAKYTEGSRFVVVIPNSRGEVELR